MRTEFNQRTWLAWLVKVRIIIVTFLLAIELAIVRLTPTNVPERAFISVIALWYTISVFFVVLLHLWQEERIQARVQVLCDLAFATAVVYLSGGIDTSFNFLYPLVIIMASILFSRAWAYFTALLSFILFGAMLELSYFDLIHSYSGTRPDPKSLQAVIFINLFAYLAIAYLASNLSAKLRQVDVELKDKSGALENLQALQENIIHSMSGGLITTDLEGRITLLNAAGEKLLETGAGKVLGKPVAQLFLDRLPVVDTAPAHAEVRCLTPGGNEKTFGFTASALEVLDRGLTGYLYAFEDLTDIRRLEREVRMRDRLAAIGRMAAGIAHEIRNPLSSIAGSVQVLAEISELSEEQKSLVDIVVRESDRLNAIISDFLLYARDKNYKMASVDLVPMLEEAMNQFESRRGTGPKLEVVRHYGVAEAYALVDRERMKQVFTNISDNAARAMPEGGRLTVSLGSAGGHWRLSFADTGKGLTTQQIEKVFEPFQSHFEGGTGLGLAIVYQILQGHGARISVNSPPRGGTEFVIELKQAAPRVVAPAEPASAAGKAGVTHG